MILQITHLRINPSERHYIIHREIPSNIRITLTQIGGTANQHFNFSWAALRARITIHSYLICLLENSVRAAPEQRGLI